jgi:hypothetical protein
MFIRGCSNPSPESSFANSAHYPAPNSDPSSLPQFCWLMNEEGGGVLWDEQWWCYGLQQKRNMTIYYKYMNLPTNLSESWSLSVCCVSNTWCPPKPGLYDVLMLIYTGLAFGKMNLHVPACPKGEPGSDPACGPELLISVSGRQMSSQGCDLYSGNLCISGVI